MTEIHIAIAQQTPEGFQNASAGFASSTELVPTMALAIIVIVFAVGLVSSARFYRWVLGASGHLASSVEYAVKGVATAAVLAVAGAPLFLLATMDAGTRSLLYRGAAVAIGGYLGLVVLGYVGERVWVRIVAQHEAATGNHPFDRFQSDKEAGDS